MIFARLTHSSGSVEWEYMKTIISLTFALMLTLSLAETASASQVYYSYNGGSQNRYQDMYQNTYQNTYQNSYQNNYQTSYSYTSGCYTYYYNGYTQATSITSYNCQNQNTYTYTSPVTYTYTTPIKYSYYTSPYYTYGYERSTGSWYPAYNNSVYNNGRTDTDYGYYYGNNNGNSYIPSNPCYYANGYYTCQ